MYIYSCDCFTIAMSYSKNKNLTIDIANVFSNEKSLRRNCYFQVTNCKGVFNSRGSLFKSRKKGESFMVEILLTIKHSKEK